MTVEHQAATTELSGSGAERSLTEGAATQDKPPRTFPHTLTILLIVTVIVWVAAMFIPAGRYQLDEDSRPIAGSYEQIESPLTFTERVTDLLLAPINGLYGVQDPETGQIGPFNSGDLFGAAQVFVFILTIGGFMTVVFATGALDLGIAHLAHRSTVNPFKIGIGSDAAAISLGDQCHPDGGAGSRLRRLQQVPQVHASVAGHLARDHACRVRGGSALMLIHPRTSRR